ncbi:uncharacterized protein LOC130376020 [Gadus chalcogrammus]|uniref:uncharacterized protein LOC130376020 n=1 Tax=Gadus chalcogrammus TaxID=1042646 RepID=UPI0024C42C9A|nr:uncharacterized protein LOC130376020 [Gadus chalcogrammus]
MRGATAGVQRKIKDEYPNAHYIHCYAHHFNLIMQQAISHISKVRIFFSDLGGFASFFSRSPKRTAVLDIMVAHRLPTSSNVRWNFHSRAINTVFEHRQDLIQCFENIRDSGDFDPKTMRVAEEICNTILGHTRECFSFTDHLVCATLLQGDRFEDHQGAFPEETLQSMLKAYKMLNGSKLKTELSLIYSKVEFRACCGAVDLFQLFMENNLEDVFSETVTLLKILITTPITTAEAERCFSTLKRVKTFLRNTMTQERLNALAMLSMEKSLVCEMTDFNQKVIEQFAGLKERRATFMFK